MRARFKELLFLRLGAQSLRCYGNIETAFGTGSFVRCVGSCSIGHALVGATPRKTATIVKLADNSGLILNDSTIGRGVAIVTGKDAEISVGKGSYVTDGSKLLASRSITIGARCAISWNVTVMDDDGHGENQVAPIIVDDDVWIGCNATILKGVTIGAGSVVATGSIVTRSFPPRSLIAGIPGRAIKENVKWKT